ncbi:MAG: hypothetical protein J6S96_06765 [Muribaculaceae bacterium]|nr:hypothetical protein [Muribaculaceae bacterium]
MRKLFIAIMVGFVLTGCSCGRSDEKASEVVADSISDVSVKQAEQLAIVAADAIAVSDTTDTLVVQRAIVDAFATRSQMMLDGNERAAKAFDKALEKELSRLNPALAEEVFSNQQQPTE